MRRRSIDQWPDIAVAALVVLLCAGLGVPLGWLWQQLSPRTLAVVTRDGFVIPEETESQVAADGRALLIAGSAGLVIGLGLWLWRSRRGPLLLLAAVAGAAATAVVMEVFGRLIGGGRSDGDTGEILTLPVQVKASAVLVAAPLAALVAQTVAALFISADDLGRPEPGRTSARELSAATDMTEVGDVTQQGM